MPVKQRHCQNEPITGALGRRGLAACPGWLEVWTTRRAQTATDGAKTEGVIRQGTWVALQNWPSEAVESSKSQSCDIRNTILSRSRMRLETIFFSDNSVGFQNYNFKSREPSYTVRDFWITEFWAKNLVLYCQICGNFYTVIKETKH